MYLPADVLLRNMNVPSMQWSSESRQLLLIGIGVLATVAFSYDYVTTEGVSDVVFVIIGAGLLLAMLAIVPVLLVNGRRSSN